MKQKKLKYNKINAKLNRKTKRNKKSNNKLKRNIRFKLRKTMKHRGGSNNEPASNTEAENEKTPSLGSRAITRAKAAVQPMRDLSSYLDKKGAAGLSVAKKSTLVEYVILLSQYAIFSIAGFLLYAPAYVINIPNSTLETLLPTGACKFFFNDKSICQSELKCLLGLCGDDDEHKVTINGGGKILKNKRLARKILENTEPRISIGQKQIGGSGISKALSGVSKELGRKAFHVKSEIGEKAYGAKRGMDKAVSSARSGVGKAVSSAKSGMYETGKSVSNEMFRTYEDVKSEVGNKVDQATQDARKSFDKAKQAKQDGNYGTMIKEGAKGVGKGLVNGTGAIAESGLNLADSVVNKGMKKAAPVVDKLSSMSGKMAQKREDPDNVNSESCKNNSSDTFCYFGKNYQYGNKHQPKENGIVKDIFVGKTPEKTMEIGISDAKHIAASLQEHMSNDDTGEFSLEKAKKVLKTNMEPKNLRLILRLMNMLELLFPNVESVSATFEDKPKNVNVLFPWTVYSENAGIRDKVACMWKHITKSELSDADYEDDLDDNNKHKCFYCKKCTLQNTAFKTIKRFFASSNNENNMEYIFQNLHDMLTRYFDIVNMDDDKHNKCALLVANIMHREIDINTLLNHPVDSYRESKSIMTANEQNDTNGEQKQDLTDLVKINEESFHIRNILTGVPEMKLNKRDTNDINISSLQTTYQIPNNWI